MQNDTAPIGTIAVRFGGLHGRSFVLCKITGYTASKNGKSLQATVEDFPGHSFPKRCIQFFCGKTSKVPQSGLYFLKDVKVPKINHSTPTSSSSRSIEKNSDIRIRVRSKYINVIPVEIEELQRDDVIIWNPDQSSIPEESYLAEIQVIAVHFNVLNQPTYYAQFHILDRTEPFMTRGDLGATFKKTKDGVLQCQAWAEFAEISKVGDIIESLHHNSMIDNRNSIPQTSEEAVGPDLLETDLDDEINFMEHNLNKARNITIPKGIQGHSNSCYIDTCLFILFSFTTVFDSTLFAEKSLLLTAQKLQKPLQQIREKLRTTFYLDWNDVTEFRTNLGEINGKYQSGCFMDAEELLLDIFDCINCPDFFEFTNKAADQIHQIIVPATEYESGHTRGEDEIYVKSLNILFQDSLWYNEVRLVQKPSPVLILKLPFCDGQPLFGCKGVVPNLTLELGSMIKDGKKECMTLFAIICLKSSHYTCFVRALDTTFSPWVYFDSSPVDMKPKVDVLDNLEYDLDKIIHDPGILWNKNASNTVEYPKHIKFICNYCYMCFYK